MGTTTARRDNVTVRAATAIQLLVYRITVLQCPDPLHREPPLAPGHATLASRNSPTSRGHRFPMLGSGTVNLNRPAAWAACKALIRDCLPPM